MAEKMLFKPPFSSKAFATDLAKELLLLEISKRIANDHPNSLHLTNTKTFEKVQHELVQTE